MNDGVISNAKKAINFLFGTDMETDQDKARKNQIENNKHMYVGFLTRGNNPNDLCMPCCFTKDHLTSKIKFKKNFLWNFCRN